MASTELMPPPLERPLAEQRQAAPPVAMRARLPAPAEARGSARRPPHAAMTRPQWPGIAALSEEAREDLELPQYEAGEPQ